MARHDPPASSLLHPLYGYGAQDIRRAVGTSHAANIAHLEGLVERARRHQALHHKHARGASVGELRLPVTFDANGHLQMRSLQPTVLIVDGDPEGNPHQVVWDIDIAELRELLEIPEGCVCCPEDSQIAFVDQGTCNCLTFGASVWNPATCTWTIPYVLDCGCINSHVGGG